MKRTAIVFSLFALVALCMTFAFGILYATATHVEQAQYLLYTIASCACATLFILVTMIANE